MVDVKGDIKSDLAEVLMELRDTGFVYTLRGELLEKGTYRVVSKYLPKNKMTCNVFPIGEIKGCKTPGSWSSHPFNICVPLEALDEYYNKSGFSDVLSWLDALHRFNYQIPQYPKTRTFYLYRLEKS